MRWRRKYLHFLLLSVESCLIPGLAQPPQVPPSPYLHWRSLQCSWNYADQFNHFCSVRHIYFMLVYEFTVIFNFKGIGRWLRSSVSAVPSVGKDLSTLLTCATWRHRGKDAHCLAKLGSLLGLHSSPAPLCRRCSVTAVLVVCVRWVLSWWPKLPVKGWKRVQYGLDDAAGCYPAEA